MLKKAYYSACLAAHRGNGLRLSCRELDRWIRAGYRRTDQSDRHSPSSLSISMSTHWFERLYPLRGFSGGCRSARLPIFTDVHDFSGSRGKTWAISAPTVKQNIDPLPGSALSPDLSAMISISLLLMASPCLCRHASCYGCSTWQHSASRLTHKDPNGLCHLC